MRFHRRPRFASVLENSSACSRLTPSSIIHDILSSKKPKMSQYFSNNTNSVNTAINVLNYTIADGLSHILTWLSPLDPRLRHQDIQGRRVGNVGEWLLQTQEFKTWCTGSEGGESGNAVLFCYGDPGAGKTYIRYKE